MRTSGVGDFVGVSGRKVSPARSGSSSSSSVICVCAL